MNGGGYIDKKANFQLIVPNIGTETVNCSTKLNNLGVGDNVLVSFPAGNKLRGQVIARL